jgi:cell division protein FtsW
MTSNVTSIAQARAAARQRAERSQVNTRTASALMVVAVVLLVIGLGATLSASSTRGLADAQDRFYFFKRQLMGVGIGTVAMLACARIRYTVYRRFAFPIFTASSGLLIAVLAFGATRYGATRWLEIGPGFQPSETAKFAVVVALAAVLEKKRSLLHDVGHYLAPLAVIVGGTGLLVMAQPDLGTTIVIAAAGLAVVWVSAAPIRYVTITSLGAVGIAGVLAVAERYRFARIRGFLDPWADPEGAGYQLIQSYLALGTGGLFGVGLGASRARWFYLPNAHTDFIFAIIGEETGLVGGLVVVSLFCVLAVAGWSVAGRAPDDFGRMLAAGITAWISVQALVNIGGVLGLLPITGIALPFVSFGSSALVVTMAALGVLVNIAQNGTAPARPPR